MTTVNIPQVLIKEKELVLIPRKKYEEFLGLEKIMESRLCEEKDTDLAVAIYKKEKKAGKLKKIKTLADLR